MLARMHILDNNTEVSLFARRQLALALSDRFVKDVPEITPPPQAETITHEILIDVCQEIGTVAESNGLFTLGLAKLLAGKTLDTLTVAELLTCIKQRQAVYNKIHARGSV
jgi:hypothetical protein